MPVSNIERTVARGRSFPPSLVAPIALQHLTCFPLAALGVDQRIVIDERPREHILTRLGSCHLDDACVAYQRTQLPYPFGRITVGLSRLYVPKGPIEQLRPKLCQLEQIPGELLGWLAV